MTELAIDTLVIGGGQAGLAAGYHLRQAGLTYHIVERSGRIGDNWRRRYSSLTLFTPRIISVLPGMSLAGDQQGYPSRDEFAAYLVFPVSDCETDRRNCLRRISGSS